MSKLHSKHRSPWPLFGETPLAAAMTDVATSMRFAIT
jgi:hypothetical protein